MRKLLAVVVAVVALVTTWPAASAPAVTSHGESCGALDRPETGIQGEVPRVDQLDGRAMAGYNCGVALVGHSDLGGRVGNANMAWAGHCAYVASVGAGVAVIDVSDPTHPRMTATLHGDGSNLAIETINALAVGGRAVLVAGRYGPAPIPLPAPMDVYDVRDCAHPRYMSTLTFPQNIHNLTISPDGKRVFATLPLQVADISDLAHPRFLGLLDAQIPQHTFLGKYTGHEAWLSPDGNTLYLGGQTPEYQTFTIVDITGWPARPARVLSQVTGRGHSIRLATINGRTYALHSEESVVDPTANGCLSEQLDPFAGPAQPWLSDVTDPRHPIMRISQFTLAINDPSNCLREVADGMNASVHYHDVDDPARTTFAMLSMWNAGLRVVDIRDPHHPREVAYFNPGAYRGVAGNVVLDQAWGHVHYDAATGAIWFTTLVGGFWVVELEPQVRHALGLPPLPAHHPLGGAPHPVTMAPVATPLGVSRYYCTLVPLAAASLG